MLCCDMQGVPDPIFVSAAQPTHCIYSGARPELRVRCEFRGCLWRRHHMLEGRGYQPKVALAIDPMLL
jgi:hypothetical protein